MSASSSDWPFVSVVIPTRGRTKLVRSCINSVMNQDFPKDRYEIIVIEDGTSEAADPVQELQKGSKIPLRYTRISHSGAATARNVGLAQSAADIVAYIDDDAIAPPEWLGLLVEALLKEKVGGAGGRVSPEYPDESLEAGVAPNGDLNWSGYNAVVPTLQEVDHLPGGNMAFWRKALLEVGGMDTGYTRRGSWREDSDLCIRLRFNGYRLLYDSRARIIHRAARWLNPLERLRPSIVWAMTRDDAYFRAKNFGWRGVGGAIRATFRDSSKRIVVGLANLVLVIAHLTAWVPGVWRGLRKKGNARGALAPR